MTFFNDVVSLPKKMISELENSPVPFFYYGITFLCILLLRSFIESFSQHNVNYLNFNSLLLWQDLLHFYFAFTSGAISLSLLFYAATGKDIVKILKVILPCFAVLLIGPIIDFTASGGHGFDMAYLDITPSKTLITLFFTFFGDFSGMTLGMRIETAITLYLSFCYFYLHGRGFFISLCYTILAYGIIFLYCGSALIVEYVLTRLGYHYIYSSLLMLRFYLIVLFITGIWAAYLANKTVFLAIMKDLRWLRLSHYIFMLLLGVALGFANQKIAIQTNNPTLIINLCFCMISIIFAGLFSIITNNFADQEIDKICNQKRPLIAGTVAVNTYQHIAIVALVLALFYASMADLKALFIIALTMANYFIYSMSPIRFKRVLIFSKLAISINSLAMILLGYILVRGNVAGFPKVIYPIFLLGFTVAANFIDIKDYEGDKKAGITTLPVLVGLRAAKLFIGIAFFCCYLGFYFLVPKQTFFYFLLLGGVVQIYLLNRKRFDERWVFLFNLFSLLVLMAYL